MERRLVDDRFDLSCHVGSSECLVHFPPSWPGAPLGRFLSMLAALTEGNDEVEANCIVVERLTFVAVGMLGVKGSVSPDGVLEIGYGFGREVWGNGYATEAVKALCSHLLTKADVRAVCAETAMGNRASERVLEKAGFMRVARNWDEGNGDLVVWHLTA